MSSCKPGIVHPAQDDLDNEVDNLNATHDGEAGEETECDANHRDLGHCGCSGFYVRSLNLYSFNMCNTLEV